MIMVSWSHSLKIKELKKYKPKGATKRVVVRYLVRLRKMEEFNKPILLGKTLRNGQLHVVEYKDNKIWLEIKESQITDVTYLPITNKFFSKIRRIKNPKS